MDTLFVNLDTPPQTVQIEGLPDNVVPICRSTKTIQCIFPNNIKESIERQQVWVLPNFAMTARASQGKTRAYNVVNLNSCDQHLAYYTALSRSASAAGTIILQGFDANVITKGCSGYLRQELRQLDILDDITRLRYEKNLPDFIFGDLRNDLIQQYLNWKGSDYVPTHSDSSLIQLSKDPIILHNPVSVSFIQLNSKDKANCNTNFKFENTLSANNSISQKHRIDSNEHSASNKRRKIGHMSNNDQLNLPGPKGLRWNAEDWSCSYDSILVILYYIWAQQPQTWTKNFRDINQEYLHNLSEDFNHVLQGNTTFEHIRDNIRHQLHQKDNNRFPLGKNEASVSSVGMELFKTYISIASSQVCCNNCEYEQPSINDNLGYFVMINPSDSRSTADWLRTMHKTTIYICPICSADAPNYISYNAPPKIIIMEYPNQDLKISHKIVFKENEEKIALKLRGIVYHGSNHFTSRIMSPEGEMWYHDGITTGHNTIMEGWLGEASDNDLHLCRNKRITLAIYAQDL